MRIKLGYRLAGALLFGMVAAAPGTAAAASATADPQAIADLLKAKGYQAELTSDGDGDPMIRSGASGAKFSVLFYGCTAHKACTNIQFYTGFKTDGSITLDKINEWNRTKRYGRAYIDGEKDPNVEMDVDLDAGGMSTALFDDNLEVWLSLMDAFQDFIG